MLPELKLGPTYSLPALPALPALESARQPNDDHACLEIVHRQYLLVIVRPLQVNGEPQPIPFCSSGIDGPGSALGTKNSVADTLDASVHRRQLMQLRECLGLTHITDTSRHCHQRGDEDL